MRDRTRRERAAFVIGAVLCASWLGCNAILGNESAVFDPGASSSGSPGPGGEGGSSGNPEASSSGFADGPTADAPDPDAGPCVDLPTNPKHCGACNHDCLGGGCQEGRCLPIPLATTADGKPTAITLDDTHVYWTDIVSGNLMRVPKNGGASEVIFDGADNEDLGKEIGVTNGHVYFAHSIGDAGLVRCPVTGCPSNAAEPVLENGAVVDSVKIEDNAILFVEFGVTGRVLRCQLPCTSGLFEIVAQNESFPLRAASNGAFQVWSVLGSGGAVRARNGASAAFNVIGSPVYAVEIVGDEIFFMDPSKGPRAVLRDGGSPRNLTTTSGLFATEMALDGNDVYFTNTSETGDIIRCPKSGCGDAGIPIARNQSRPIGIAVDAKSVYWANQGGVIQRVAK